MAKRSPNHCKSGQIGEEGPGAGAYGKERAIAKDYGNSRVELL